MKELGLLVPIGVKLRRLGPLRAAATLLTGVRGAGRARHTLLVAMLANVVLFSAFFVGIVMAVFAVTAPLAANQEGFFVLLSVVIRIASLAGAVLLAPILFQFVAATALLLFRERLFRIGRLVGGASPDEQLEGSSLLTVLATEIWRLVRLLVVSALLFLLNAIPIVGSVAYVIAQALVASHALAWDLLSPHFEMRGLSYQEQKAALKEGRVAALAFGGGALGLSLIPIANFLFLSTNVIGAGVLSAKLDES